MEKKTKNKKWVIIIVVVALIFIIGISNSGKKDKSTTDSMEAAEVPETISPRSVEDVLSDLNLTATEIEENDGYLFITYTQPNTPHDYTDFVNMALTDFVNIGKELFTEYSTMRIDMQAESTNGDINIITSFIMSRDNFSSIKWDDIEFLPGSYNDIVKKFDKFYVESMVMKDVDTEKIYYKGHR